MDSFFKRIHPCPTVMIRSGLRFLIIHFSNMQKVNQVKEFYAYGFWKETLIISFHPHKILSAIVLSLWYQQFHDIFNSHIIEKVIWTYLFKLLNFFHLRAYLNILIFFHDINTYIFYINTLESPSMTYF